MVECLGLTDKPTGLSAVSHCHLTGTPAPKVSHQLAEPDRVEE